MNEFIVRSVEVKDYKDVYNLLITCSDETDYLACDSTERIEGGFSIEGTKKWLENIRNNKNGIEQFLCIENGVAIGMLGLHEQNRSRFKHRVSLGMNIYKSHWGQGIGSLLLEKALDEFNKNATYTKLELDVRADNERAIALYKKFGFEVEAEYKNFFKVDGIYYNGYHMAIIKSEE